MRLLGGVLLSLLLAIPAAAEDWTAVVVKAKRVTDDGRGNVIIELPSGGTIQLSKQDLSAEWSRAIEKALKNQEMAEAARSSAAPPTEAAALALIRSHCASEWRDDFRMRKYCEDKQLEGLRALRARRMTGQLSGIRSKCANEWPDDFRMRDYCENRQLEALRQLGH